MKQRISIQHLSPQEKIIEEEEASLDTHAITGKDEGKIATLAYAPDRTHTLARVVHMDDWLEAAQRIVSRGEGRGF